MNLCYSLYRTASLYLCVSTALWIVNLRQYLCLQHQLIHAPSFIPTETHSFSDPSGGDKRYYRYLMLNSQNDSIYVGAMEYLYRLNADNINITSGNYQKSAHLQSDTAVTAGCVQNKKSRDFQCKNHIRIIVFEKDRIYVCGTSSYQPREFYLNTTNLLEEGRGRVHGGMGKCPQNPDDKSTAVYIRNGNPYGIAALYSGIVIVNNQRRDPILLRPPLKRPNGDSTDLLRTMIHNTAWLNDVHFVGSFDMDQYVFFFFRENPVKSSNHDNVVYSRVARVCKSDMGGESSLDKRWTTFLKARLNCSIPGGLPFYFNEIYDVYKVGDNLFYGLFTTNLNGYYGSAICVFSLEDINGVFSGSFSDPNNGGLAVPESSVPSPRPGKCTANSKTLPDNILQFIKLHPLMSRAVPSRHGNTVFHIAGVVLKHIVVYTLSNYVLFYLVSEKGAIYKVVQWENKGITHSNLLAVWKPFGDNSVTVWTTKILNDSIYLGTDEQVLQINRKQCSQYKSCTHCVRDPDCGWDMDGSLCQNFAHGLIQSVTKDGVCKKHNICFSGENNISIRIQGDAVHLQCKTNCALRKPRRWFHNNSIVKSDYKKWILTQQNGLVIFDTTDKDAGVYECRVDNAVLSRHRVNISDCNSIDCLWKKDHREWGRELHKYKQQFDEWACMKNSCDLSSCGNSVRACGGR